MGTTVRTRFVCRKWNSYHLSSILIPCCQMMLPNPPPLDGQTPELQLQGHLPFHARTEQPMLHPWEVLTSVPRASRRAAGERSATWFLFISAGRAHQHEGGSWTFVGHIMASLCVKSLLVITSLRLLWWQHTVIGYGDSLGDALQALPTSLPPACEGQSIKGPDNISSKSPRGVITNPTIHGTGKFTWTGH